jgi:superfamily II DNA or RNA helicase
MLNKLNYPASCTYSTGTEDEPFNFFVNVLPESRQFDMLLGYFSSSAIRVLALGFAKFLLNGGHARFVINHILSENDKAAILRGEQKAVSDLPNPLENYERLKMSLDTEGVHFFNCLAWLIAEKRVQIVSVRPKGGTQGIAHYKSGIFSDGLNQVAFSGSCNFTGMGLLNNLEELDIKQSWLGIAPFTESIKNRQAHFDSLFNGKADYVDYLTIEDIETAIRTDFGNKDLQELLADEEELIRLKKEKLKTNPKLRKRLDALEKEYQILRQQPRFPFAGGARPYQAQAYQNWLENDRKGIFAMATGTGKTITALNCVLEESRKSEKKAYRGLILVPTISLIEQWEREVQKFNFNEIIKISSKTDWESALSSKLTFAKRLTDESFIAIATYTTFARDKFQSYLRRFPLDTILIADEAHNIASPKVLQTLDSVKLQKRIGLSATPKRIYDPEGSAVMESFFKDTEPYTYSFSMERAINEKILCPYYYYPHIVRLTDSEFESYKVLTKKLMQFFDFEKGVYKDNDFVTKLLLARKRIIHKAEQKLDLTEQILRKQFEKKGNLKYTLVYVPEGFEKSESDTFSENEDELRLINQYCEVIHRISNDLHVSQFISGIPNRDEVLKQFENGYIHVLSSMKCLDEGVDLPRAEFAIFCSSTGNPRQFIQRRGRILRKHAQKHIATVHDLVVIPNFSHTDTDKNAYTIERSLVRKELERVMYFASLAINPFETDAVFNEVCSYYDLNLSTIKNELKTV